MITDQDIEKLKKVFVTKDDLKALATKDDIKLLDKRMDQLDSKIDHVLLELGEDIGNVMKEAQDIKYEIRSHRVIINDYKRRQKN